MAWSGVEWSGVAWSGVEWTGLDWNGMEWNGVAWRGLESRHGSELLYSFFGLCSLRIRSSIRQAQLFL